MNEETEVNEDVQPTEENGQINQIESVSEEMGKLNFSVRLILTDIPVRGYLGVLHLTRCGCSCSSVDDWS
jgi:hypothetical protein